MAAIEPCPVCGVARESLETCLFCGDPSEPEDTETFVQRRRRYARSVEMVSRVTGRLLVVGVYLFPDDGGIEVHACDDDCLYAGPPLPEEWPEVMELMTLAGDLLRTETEPDPVLLCGTPDRPVFGLRWRNSE